MLKMDKSGLFVSGKILSRYFAIRAKNKNLAGRSGIWVLVVGFSQIEAVKKHALLVFNSQHLYSVRGLLHIFSSHTVCG